MSLVLALSRAVTEARRRRYDERSSDITERENPRDLHGECVRNAYVLSAVLDEFGVDHRIICGGLNTDALETPPETIRNTRDKGYIHYWCETDEEPGYIIDIASEIDNREGLPLITQKLPKRYLHLVDGVDFKFEIEPHVE